MLKPVIRLIFIALQSLALLGPVFAQPARNSLPLPPPAADIDYVARKGDTMIGIARRYLIEGQLPGVQKALQQHNKLRDADRIDPQQVIRIPSNWVRTEQSRLEVSSLQGDVKSKGQALQSGASLETGDELLTGRDGYVTIKLADGSTLALQPGSTMEIERVSKSALSPSPEAVFMLKGGRTQASVQKRSASGPRFEVRTPMALAAVRGTEFRVSVDEARRATTSEVLEGAVMVSDAERRGGVEVPDGYGTRVLEGRTPLAPRPLLPAPTVWGGVRLVVRRPINLPFLALRGAAAYRVLLAQGGSVMYETIIDRPEIVLEDLPNGNYTMRVRGIDDIGLEGRDWTGELWLRIPG